VIENKIQHFRGDSPIMIALIELFCDVDDFLKAFLPEWEKHQLAEEPVKKRHRAFTLAEVMVIVLWFHRSHY